MTSGTTAQDPTWKSKEQSEEARYVHEREQAQLAAIRDRQRQVESNQRRSGEKSIKIGGLDRDFEGGFGGQEDLEDRYATTSGEH